MAKITTAKEALKVIKSGDFVYIHGGAAVPEILVNALVARTHELKNVTIGHIHIEGDAPYADPKYKDSFYIDSFFLSKNVRHIIKAGNGSYTPIFLSDMPLLFDRKHINVDVVLITSISSTPAVAILLLMLLSFLLSLCSEADAFIGSSLIASFGLSPVLAFLVIGPMLDVKNLLMMKNYFKTRFIWQFISLVTVVVFLYSCLVGVVL